MTSRAQTLTKLISKWTPFTLKTELDRSVFWFLAVFFAILCVYDFLDIFWGGTASSYWLVSDADRTLSQLLALQLALLALQAGIVAAAIAGLRSCRVRAWIGTALGAVFVLRAIEAWFFFGLNDFYFFSVTTFIGAHFFLSSVPPGRLPSWPRRVLLYQTAWIYLATGILKLNPHWLGGDHLWIRQKYVVEVLGWSRPDWLNAWVTRLEVNQALAIAGAAGEICLGLLLAFEAPRWMTVALAASMHGFAAVALNVWFFGATMVAQVCFVTAPRTESKSIS
jgi:hypothetical protein